MTAFEAIALKIDDGCDAEFLHAFIWGLKDKIKAEVRLRDPKTL